MPGAICKAAICLLKAKETLKTDIKLIELMESEPIVLRIAVGEMYIASSNASTGSLIDIVMDAEE